MAQGHGKQAQEHFTQTCRLLKDSGDLQTGTEVRIRILLNMVSALCCKHGVADRELMDDYLNVADTLRQALPRIGARTMTVFSPLSKKNETSETIGVHLELIKMGKVLVE